MTETQRLQQEYWSAFHALFRQHSGLHITPNPHPCHWTEVRFGNTTSIFSVRMNTLRKQKQVSVQLVIEGKHRKQTFARLYQNRGQIEHEIGQPLRWEEPAGTKEKVSLSWSSTDPLDRESWADQHAWLLRTVETFYRVFAPQL